MTARPSSPRRSRLRLRAAALAVALATLAAPLTAAAAPAAASPPPRDTVTVGGYHFETHWPADVVAGGTGNLAVRYVAGAPLADGVLTVDLPQADFPTPLAARDFLTGLSGEAGGVVVRPDGTRFLPGDGDCSGPVSWTVTRTATAQQVRVEHLTCRPGQQITIRLFRVAAPAVKGWYPIAVAAADAAGPRAVQQPLLAVVPTPTVSLAVTTPPVIPLRTDVPVTVRALDRHGRVDTGYRGRVSLVLPGDGCQVGDLNAPYGFTAADAGVHVFTVRLMSPLTPRIQAYDVAQRAVPGTSAPFEIASADWYMCPVSFH